MLWLVCFSFFPLSLSFPFDSVQGRNELKNYQVQVAEYKGLPYQRHSVCLPSPFLRQICLPSALRFFIPLQTVETGRRRCLTIPIMRSYVIKVCPPVAEATSEKENSRESFEEIIQQVVKEEEKERLSDNTNIEVNGEEVKSEEFVKEESIVETKGSQAEDKKSKNNVFRDLKENDVEGNESFERLLTEENISITSNLV